jgi:hypothetical protein
MLQFPAKLFHRVLGPCELLRIEGTTWIIRHSATGNLYRVPPTRRHEYEPLTQEGQFGLSPHAAELQPVAAAPAGGTTRSHQHLSPEDAVLRAPSQVPLRDRPPSHVRAETAPPSRGFAGAGTLQPSDAAKGTPNDGHVAVRPYAFESLDAFDPRRLRRAIHSLRTGLTPADADIEPFAIGIENTMHHVDEFLAKVKIDGGDAVVIRGAYGQGKTFTLQLVEEAALKAGYAVVSTEIDAAENRLDKPHHVYQSMMRNLRLPGGSLHGVESLVEKAGAIVNDIKTTNADPQHAAFERYDWLLEQLDCEPLAWILSDPGLLRKGPLVKLLAGDTDVSVAHARRLHVNEGRERTWPRFRFGTQGDFGSYLLSGLGLLSRLLGYNGLIVVMDEMEKWQDLNWFQQSRAGNFLGGVIWAATAETGRRQCAQAKSYYGRSVWANCDHPKRLEHSGWIGGYSFTTRPRCHLGLAIAMTPRGASSPEASWKEFGPLAIVDLPEFNRNALNRYVARIGSLYQRAYGLESPIPTQVSEEAYQQWRQRGDRSARSGVTSTIEALDNWRGAQNLVIV